MKKQVMFAFALFWPLAIPAEKEVIHYQETPAGAAIRGINEGFTGLGSRMINNRHIIGWQTVRTPGRPLKECMEGHNELNEEVLRCRNGYEERVPIFNR